MTAIAPLQAQIEELRRVVSPPKPAWETPINALNLSYKAWIDPIEVCRNTLRFTADDRIQHEHVDGH
jgi:hypothetical protein